MVGSHCNFRCPLDHSKVAWTWAGSVNVANLTSSVWFVVILIHSSELELNLLFYFTEKNLHSTNLIFTRCSKNCEKCLESTLVFKFSISCVYLLDAIGTLRNNAMCSTIRRERTRWFVGITNKAIVIMLCIWYGYKCIMRVWRR